MTQNDLPTCSDESDSLHTEFTQTLIDLAAERLGGQTLACSDDFFAPMENLIKPGRGVFIADKYTERGKWMDGWESRRSFGRDNGRDRDWCVLRLGAAGVVHGIDVDTHHFRGNAPLSVSLHACARPDLSGALRPGLRAPDASPTDLSPADHLSPNTLSQGPPAVPAASEEAFFNERDWVELLPQSPVAPHSQNLFRIDNDRLWTHVRLTIFPDGGVARLRVYGNPKPDWSRFLPGEPIDLAAIKNGARALLCSDMFFSDKNNLLMPGRGADMGDGWETRRRRDGGNDWVIVKLACRGSVGRVLIDTHHFKGNFPDRFSLEGTASDSDDFTTGQHDWETIIPPTPLAAHREHLFIDEIQPGADKTYTHVRLNIFPDGGVSRLRIFGYRREEAE